MFKEVEKLSLAMVTALNTVIQMNKYIFF